MRGIRTATGRTASSGNSVWRRPNACARGARACDTRHCGSRSGAWGSRRPRCSWRAEGSNRTARLFFQLAGVFGAVLEFGLGVEVDEVDGADGAVALFGDDQLGEAAEIFAVSMVDLFAEDEADDVGVLLDGAGFAE